MPPEPSGRSSESRGFPGAGDRNRSCAPVRTALGRIGRRDRSSFQLRRPGIQGDAQIRLSGKNLSGQSAPQGNPRARVLSRHQGFAGDTGPRRHHRERRARLRRAGGLRRAGHSVRNGFSAGFAETATAGAASVRRAGGVCARIRHAHHGAQLQRRDQFCRPLRDDVHRRHRRRPPGGRQCRRGEPQRRTRPDHRHVARADGGPRHQLRSELRQRGGPRFARLRALHAAVGCDDDRPDGNRKHQGRRQAAGGRARGAGARETARGAEARPPRRAARRPRRTPAPSRVRTTLSAASDNTA